LRLRDYLCVPYLLEAQSAEVSPGEWVIRIRYPELPGCSAESLSLEDGLRILDRNRIETIIALLQRGEEPPVPRPPLMSCDPIWLAAEADLAPETVALIDRNELGHPGPPSRSR
jgi:hypothetical protein